MKAFEIREKPYRSRGRERLWSGKLVGPDQPLAQDRAGETAKIPLGAQERTESVLFSWSAFTQKRGKSSPEIGSPSRKTPRKAEESYCRTKKEALRIRYERFL
jgi:hypothetical protein